MIELKNVSLAFDKREVLKNFNATFQDKGIVLITGPSGSGKTTVTRLVAGLTAADSGSVSTDGVKISVVFQEDRLVPSLSALDNVALVSNKTTAEKWLSVVELSESQSLFPDELSGGMKRRVAIARALAFGGDVLVLDEAFNGINEDLAKRILAKIAEEYKNKLIIAVTHQPELFSDYNYNEIKI